MNIEWVQSLSCLSHLGGHINPGMTDMIWVSILATKCKIIHTRILNILTISGQMVILWRLGTFPLNGITLTGCSFWQSWWEIRALLNTFKIYISKVKARADFMFPIIKMKVEALPLLNAKLINLFQNILDQKWKL